MNLSKQARDALVEAHGRGGGFEDLPAIYVRDELLKRDLISWLGWGPNCRIEVTDNGHLVAELLVENERLSKVAVVDYADDRTGERYRNLLRVAVESSGVDAQSVELLASCDTIKFICTAKTKVDEHALARAIGEVLNASLDRGTSLTPVRVPPPVCVCKTAGEHVRSAACFGRYLGP